MVQTPQNIATLRRKRKIWGHCNHRTILSLHAIRMHTPHQGLGGRCPAEVNSGRVHKIPEHDPRKTPLELAVSYQEGRNYFACC